MAEDNKKNEGQEEGGKSKKKLIIIIAIVVILSIGLSVGATLFFLKGDGGATQEAEVPAVEVKKPAVYLDIKPPFVVTYDVSGRQRYMQVFVSIQSRDQSSLDLVELHMPLIRNKLIMLFSGQDFEKLQTPEGKESLRTESLSLINEMLEKEASGTTVEQVLFTNFVMQ